MTDAQSVAYHEYGYPESRTQPRLDPKLRGWRIDRAEGAKKLARILRKRARQALHVSMDYSESIGYKAAKDAKEELETTKQLRKQFAKHTQRWKAETAFSSSVHQITAHPSYLRIIGMGSAALPLIFEELEKRPGHWFSALYAITDENPVPDRDAGRIKKMAHHWINWGRLHGFY